MRKILFILTVLIMCLSVSTHVSAAVKISSKNIVLIKGQSKVLKITGTKAKVSWATDKKAVATVTAKGKVTAKSKGSAVVTAKVGKKKYTCKVKVETPKISSSKITMTEGQSKTLKISGTTQKVTWSSNKKTVATVSQKGVVTAKSFGAAKITAKVGSRKYTCTVNVIKETTTGSYKTYGESTYRVGITIPAGQYALFTTSSISGYFEISSDSTGSLGSIIANDNFDYNSIITVKNGQYLELSRCKAVPIAHVKISSNIKGGMYRVGIDIKPGEYMLETTSSIMGYYEVASSDSHSLNDIVTNDNFNGAAYVTVENGQYLKLSRCKMSKYRKLQ